jgi:hypothetical protein
MNFAKTTTLAAFALGASLAMSTPALAQNNQFVKSPSFVQPNENVLLDTDVTPGDNQLRGTLNQSNTKVLFRSSTDNLLSPPQGQATIVATDNSLGSLVFSLEDLSTFTQAEFNILASTAGQVTLSAFGAGTFNLNGTLSGTGPALFTQTFDLATAGQNFFGFNSTTPVSFVQITAINGAVISSIGQFRIEGVQMAGAVPEPATWAMMLFGFGAVGYSMRSRRRVGFKAIQAI